MSANTYNGVIMTATGDLLRCGFCDFENDGSFDPATETMRTDAPFPGHCINDDDYDDYHQWTGSEWILVPK